MTFVGTDKSLNSARELKAYARMFEHVSVDGRHPSPHSLAPLLY